MILLIRNMDQYYVQLLAEEDLFRAHYLFSLGISPIYWMLFTLIMVLNINLAKNAGKGDKNKVISYSYIGIL